MELIVGPANLETFLLNLIVSYLKLEERGKIRVIALSDVLSHLPRLPPRLSNWATSRSTCPV